METNLEKQISKYISTKYGMLFEAWMMNADRYIIYTNMIEAFLNYEKIITVEKKLAIPFAQLVLSYAPKYGIEINVANKTNEFYYLSLTGYEKQLRDLNNFCTKKYNT